MKIASHRWATASGAAILALTLAACGGADAGSDTGSDSSGGDSSGGDSSGGDSSSSASGSVAVDGSSTAYPMSVAAQELLNEENPDVKVTVGESPFFAVPLGIAAALYLEEFADSERWWNRLIEVNLQKPAAVPSIVYGLPAVAAMALVGFGDSGIVLGGAVALALLILPVIIITTREALRAVPRDIRDGSLALGPTVWQTTWRQTLPSAIPGIATGTILGLSRAIGEAAPLVIVGLAGSVLFDPTGLMSQATALPMQIYSR